MSITRRWYAYIGSRGGQLNQANYILQDFFPSCDITGNNICCVWGIYEIRDAIDPSNNKYYGNTPQTFAQDTLLASYIAVALAQPSFYPAAPGQKPYVYKKSFS
jgi:hypothetical protein